MVSPLSAASASASAGLAAEGVPGADPGLFRVVREVSATLLQAREEGMVLAAVTSRLAEATEADFSVLFLHDGQSFAPVASLGCSSIPPPRLDALIGPGWQGEGTDIHQLVGLRTPEFVTALPAGTPHELLVIPLPTHGAPMGALMLGRQRPWQLAAPDRDILWMTGQLLAAGLRERRLQAKLDVLRRQYGAFNQEPPLPADVDEETGVLKRECMLQHLERTVAEALHSGDQLSILLLEIDHFALLAERQDAAFADVVLRRVGGTIQKSIRGRDLAARFGSEEFCLVLPATPGLGAVVVAERLRERLSGLRFDGVGGGVSVTISIGVACLSNRVASTEQLLAKVEDCFFEAKALGGNQIVFDWDQAIEVADD
jgi:diguanylate cyclase (GGDEF)-like protein